MSPGEMDERTRCFDWSRTPVGPAGGWPGSLKTVVRVMLDSRYAMWLGWGPDLTFFYNDAYARMTLGPKHPWALGRPAREVWSEIWPDIEPRARSVLHTGVATWDEGLLLFLQRQGFPEETYHTFSYSPVPDDGGGIGGLLCVVTEDTERTIGERRLATLRELAARTPVEAQSAEDACQAAAQLLAGNPHDLPFVLIYLLDAKGTRAELAGVTGVGRGRPYSPPSVDLLDDACPWPFARVAEGRRAVEVTDLIGRFGPMPGGPWPDPAQRAAVLPIAKPGQERLAGFLVAGVSARRPFDDAYVGFLDLTAGQIATAVANARAYEEEKRRAELLAELDRAKTAFFNNVSHEFRTPLTLMLGPLEELLACRAEMPGSVVGPLELVNRNGLRLLRLVNTLLDFSRIEAGRARAAYEPTDLASVTAEMASVFRAAVERAGLRLTVDCRPVGEPVYVDREMWEKVVLNLLSNAFKFTFEGEIAVTLRRAGDAAELRVSDTGTGIPADELPRLFERFHRVDNARARTHEGSGIGLALVQELVRLHGGQVGVESVVGVGTTFTVTVPLGTAHLPPERIGGPAAAGSAAARAAPFVEEALRWLPDAPEPAEPEAVPAAGRPRVLVADDNADMRQYVTRLLAGRYEVEAVADGEAALAAARRRPPDLVLTDVMMPRLDGFG
ncbi:MAG: hybrid sensor histidine kinase/response regulator, partial [Gemmataceae bacterium]